MSVSLAEVALAAQARQAPLAAESAGYLVLAVADQVVLAARSLPRQAIELGEDGAVRLRAGEPTSEELAEAQLRRLLADLLGAASSSTPALSRVASRDSRASVAQFVAELEAALIPVNRAAARRALGRLARETSRAVDRGLLEAPPAPEPRPAPAAPSEVSLVAPPAALPVVPPERDIEPELALEPLLETRPEPLARRSVASSSEASAAQTPPLGTLIAPAHEVTHELAALTDPMPDVVAIEPDVLEIEPDAVEIEIDDVLETASAEPIEVEPESPAAAPEPPRRPVVVREPRRSELGSLLKAFTSNAGPTEPELRRELKKIAGLELTPAPTTVDEAGPGSLSDN